MRRGLTLGLLLLTPAPAFAATWQTPDRLHHDRPYLTIRRAQRALTANARQDRPKAITLTGCKRRSSQTVGCWVTETDITLDWTDDGEPIVATMNWWALATLKHDHVAVRLASN